MLTVCNVLGDPWQTQLRERKNINASTEENREKKWYRGRNTENIQAVVSSRKSKHSAKFFGHCPSLVRCPTCKSLAAGFTGAVKLRKIRDARGRELPNPLFHLQCNCTSLPTGCCFLLPSRQGKREGGNAQHGTATEGINNTCGSCHATIASQPNTPWALQVISRWSDL